MLTDAQSNALIDPKMSRNSIRLLAYLIKLDEKGEDFTVLKLMTDMQYPYKSYTLARKRLLELGYLVPRPATKGSKINWEINPELRTPT